MQLRLFLAQAEHNIKTPAQVKNIFKKDHKKFGGRI